MGCRCPSESQRGREYCVRAKPRFIGRPVKCLQGQIQIFLVQELAVDNGSGDRAANVRDRFEASQSSISLQTVSKLFGFRFACRCPGRDRDRSDGAVSEYHRCSEGRTSTAIEYLNGMKVGYSDHLLQNRLVFRGAYPFCEAGDDPIHGGEILVDHFNGNLPLDEAFLIGQVLERRPTADSRQNTCQRVFRRAKVKVSDPGNPADFVEISIPVPLCPFYQREALFMDVKRFAQEMGETEADVERWVTEMKHFVIKQDQSLAMYKNVFRTKIAVNQRVGATQRPCDKLFQKGSGLRDRFCAALVVRFQSQGCKEPFFGEDRLKFVPEPEAFTVDGSKQFRKTAEKISLNLGGQ